MPDPFHPVERGPTAVTRPAAVKLYSFASTMHAALAKEGQNGTRAITRALEVLCCFTSHRHEWGITEMAEHLGYSRSVIHRIVTTLEMERFVVRTAEHRYRLGTRALELGQSSRVANKLVWEAEPKLDALAKRTDGVTHLAILEGHQVVELARSTSRRGWSPSAQPHFRMPVHATALGKVLLAYSPQETQDRFLALHRQFPKLTEKTITGPATLRAHLNAVAEQGYALDDEECRLGHRCVAIPVYDSQERVTAALSVSKKMPCLLEPELYSVLKDMLLTSRTLAVS